MSFDTFRAAARPLFGTVSGSPAAARVAVTGKRKYAAVAALAEDHGGTVAPDTGQYPQLMTLRFAVVCARCGGTHRGDESCGCFDNHAE